MSFTQHHCQSLTYTKSSASTGFSVIVTPPDTRIRLKFKMEIFLIIDSPKIFLLIKKTFGRIYHHVVFCEKLIQQRNKSSFPSINSKNRIY